MAREKNKRKKIFIWLSLLFFLILAIIINFTSPSSEVVFVSFMILFGASFFLFSFIFKNNRRGLLAGLGIVGFFLLKYTKAYNYFSLAVLFFLILTLELLGREDSLEK